MVNDDEVSIVKTLLIEVAIMFKKIAVTGFFSDSTVKFINAEDKD